MSSNWEPRPVGKPVQVGNPHVGEVLYVQNVQQKNTALEQAKNQDAQSLQGWSDNGDGAQQLKQFSQQTESELSSYGKF